MREGEDNRLSKCRGFVNISTDSHAFSHSVSHCLYQSVSPHTRGTSAPNNFPTDCTHACAYVYTCVIVFWICVVCVEIREKTFCSLHWLHCDWKAQISMIYLTLVNNALNTSGCSINQHPGILTCPTSCSVEQMRVCQSHKLTQWHVKEKRHAGLTNQQAHSLEITLG